LPLGEDVEQLAPDIARRSDDRDPVTHVSHFRWFEPGGELGVAPLIVNAAKAVTIPRLVRGATWQDEFARC
jgi:hypothetical protein